MIIIISIEISLIYIQNIYHVVLYHFLFFRGNFCSHYITIFIYLHWVTRNYFTIKFASYLQAHFSFSNSCCPNNKQTKFLNTFTFFHFYISTNKNSIFFILFFFFFFQKRNYYLFFLFFNKIKILNKLRKFYSLFFKI
jgi:hypothetical protein